ncbi:tryptophan 7-halogenase [Alteromonas sediminis]|uniref:Tryptophan 7-halogenase n=1 Tax=Alteromonas sediminis TaxID=2259342 RepID=A0A3N5ZAK0_9ALTE|nr:tryptophan halogenase family protein [Alteromonas sediminis]RPJ66508.1 tryptophan 7-halogenase [Alteromonas sediminis]
MWKKIIIAGGGTAGWMTAALLAKSLGRAGFEITLVESPNIPTVGVGEATVPSFMHFNRLLGIDERHLIKQTKATYKLGIQFVDWEKIGNDYIHGFGALGDQAAGLPFYHYWFRWLKSNPTAKLEDMSLCAVSGRKRRFVHPDPKVNPILGGMGYALHIDAGLYAEFLKQYSTERGIKHIQADITGVNLNQKTGFISSLNLADSSVLEGDFFIDCTGFKSMLLGQALRVPFVSWKQWLKTDSAQVLPTALTQDNFVPYTRAKAHHAGWQWRIPLQHRVGNGLVYSSEHMTDQEAEALLLEQIDSEPLMAPRKLHFEAGMRERFWEKNCVAVGLSSGFLEPLESTSIHIIQTTISRLVTLFPNADTNEVMAKRFNAQATFEMERIRDFIILHYALNHRDDPFWRSLSEMRLPDSLEEKITLFKKTGYIHYEDGDLFADTNWLSVLFGQGVRPENSMYMVNTMSDEQLDKYISSIRHQIVSLTDNFPFHIDYLTRLLKS